MTTHLPKARGESARRPAAAVEPRSPTFSDDGFVVVIALFSMVAAVFFGGFLLTAMYLAAAALVVARWGLTPNSGSSAFLAVWPLLAILAIGLFGSFGAEHEANFIRRDIWTYGRAIVVVWLGFLLGVRLGPGTLLRVTILAGLAVSAYHIGLVLTNITVFSADSANGFRGEIGRGFVQPALAVAAALTAYRWRVREAFRMPALVSMIAVVGSVGSLFLSFSRTMLTIAVMMAVFPLLSQMLSSATGGIKAGVRARKVFIFVLFAAAAMVMGLSVTTAGQDFADKIGDSITELTSNEFETKAQIIQSFRSYERERANEMFDDGSLLEKSVGFGFGQTVDLGFTLEFGGDLGEFRYVPVLHDGLTTTKVKAGYIGLGLLLIWHGFLWLTGRRLKRHGGGQWIAWGEIQMYGAAALLLVTPSVSGALNTRSMDSLLLLLGAGVAYLQANRLILRIRHAETVG